jgi:hypothetical protein
MITRHFRTDGQPNARARKFTFAMEPLKNAKDAVGMLLLEANAIIDDIDPVVERG